MLALLMSWALMAPLRAATLERVVARINEDIITIGDLSEAVEGHIGVLKKQPNAEKVMSRLKPDLLRAMFDRTLLLQAAKQQQIGAPADEIDVQVEELVAEIKRDVGSDSRFRQELAKNGMTPADFKKALRLKAEGDFKAYAVIARKMRVSDAEAAEFEKQEKAAGKTPIRVHLRRLAVAVEGSGKEAEDKAKEKAAELLNRINSEGLSFEAGVRKYSGMVEEREIGGDLGFITAEQLSPAVLSAVENLQPGQATKPIIAGGFACIFYVVAKREAKSFLQEKRFAAERDKLLKDLRAKARIEIYDERLRKLLPAEYRTKASTP